MQNRTYLTEWKNFLLEEQQITINPADYEGRYSDFRKDFEEAVKKSRGFVQSFLDVFVRIELRPLMRSLSQEDRKALFNHIKALGHIPNFQFVQDKVIPNIMPDSALAKASLDGYALYDLLKYYVAYFTNDEKIKNFVEKRLQTSPGFFVNIYWDLFKKYPEEIPVVSKLTMADTSSDELKHNFNIISKDFKNLDIKDLKNADILQQIKIIERIGAGAFGKVYAIEGERALKLFKDSVDVQKDIERYESVIDQVYKGKASLEDMHYFDFGKLGESGLYYAIMPKIVPLEKVDFYNQEPIFRAVASGCKHAAQKGAKDYERFKWLVLDSASLNYTSLKNKIPTTLSFQQALNKNQDKVEKIIQAGFRAFSEFDGIDLNQGNIGFFAQKPDTYFYFDM
jgi:hypothetical protein